MEAEKLAWFIQSYMQSYEPPPEHLISNYVESEEHTSIKAVRIDGQFDLYELAYAVLDYIEWEDS